MSLPHNEHFNDLSAADAVERLLKNPADDLSLATSQGFWDEAEESIYEEVSEAYQGYFEKKRDELSILLGPPSYQGDWTREDYPLYATGHEISVWQVRGKTVYLRLEQEDREIGFAVELATPESLRSNHELVSPYAKTREWMKKEKQM